MHVKRWTWRQWNTCNICSNGVLAWPFTKVTPHCYIHIPCSFIYFTAFSSTSFISPWAYQTRQLAVCCYLLQCGWIDACGCWQQIWMLMTGLAKISRNIINKQVLSVNTRNLQGRSLFVGELNTFVFTCNCTCQLSTHTYIQTNNINHYYVLALVWTFYCMCS